ncbi:hypothetical protein CXF85_19815 [Colwellia sp. 75C3]|nr:hypothetical protein CXF85_19815 [Colwellia sp. 75C3]
MTAQAVQFIHPLDFDNSLVQRKEVAAYIRYQVKEDYCNGAVDMCQPSMLRMMENQNLSSFKKLMFAEDRKILDQVIDTYCDGVLDMCSYFNLNMMYRTDLKASKKTLTW